MVFERHDPASQAAQYVQSQSCWDKKLGEPMKGPKQVMKRDAETEDQARPTALCTNEARKGLGPYLRQNHGEYTDGDLHWGNTGGRYTSAGSRLLKSSGNREAPGKLAGAHYTWLVYGIARSNALIGLYFMFSIISDFNIAV